MSGNDDQAKTPAIVWIIGYIILMGVIGMATRGGPHTDAPPGDVNCIGPVYMVGCTP